MATSQTRISAAAIEAAAAAARMRGGGRFTLAEVLAGLPEEAVRDELAERVSRLLESDETLFWDESGEQFAGRAEFFSGAEFLITPDELEIEAGILIPGHRFAPFVSAEVFPSEVVLKDAADGQELPRRKYEGELTTLFPYHMLLGSEQVFDFFIAEDPVNQEVVSRSGSGKELTLHVFDMRAFYDKHSFSSGDALWCTVQDWSKGKIRCRFLSGEDRRNDATRGWCERFAEALERVIDRFEQYFDIPEQLAWSFFEDGALLRNGDQAASLDEFIRMTDRVEVAYDAGHTALTRRSGDEEADADDGGAMIPEGVRVSRGMTDSLGGILQELGLAITPVEIDGFILDCCYYREFDFESFFARCFGREPLTFADEAQEAVFRNYVEDRWEDLTGNYNRTDDEPKAELRSSILDLVETRLEFLNALRGAPEAASKLPEPEMRRLAELALYLDELLRLLNSPEHTLEPEEADAMSETIAGVEETQEHLLEHLDGHLAE